MAYTAKNRKSPSALSIHSSIHHSWSRVASSADFAVCICTIVVSVITCSIIGYVRQTWFEGTVPLMWRRQRSARPYHPSNILGRHLSILCLVAVSLSMSHCCHRILRRFSCSNHALSRYCPQFTSMRPNYHSLNH